MRPPASLLALQAREREKGERKKCVTIVRWMTHGITGKVVKCDNNDAMENNRVGIISPSRGKTHRM